MTDEEHARKYASESISLAISMYNPKAEDIAFFACLYGLTYKNDEIKKLKQQIEKMKCCWNCKYGENSENKLPCSSCNKNWIVRKRLKKLSDKWEIKE